MRNLLRFLAEWKVLRRGVVSHLPLEVSVEVTNVCNFACAFCPQSSPTHFDVVPRIHLAPEQAREILQQVRRLGYDRPLLHWTLDGEPFVNRQFAQICEVARALGFTNQYFATNLALTTVEVARSLPRAVRYTLTVDFCADPAYFEEHRGTPGSWQVVHDNLRDILAADDLGHIAFEVTDITPFTVDDPAARRTAMNQLRALFPAGDRLRFHDKTFHNMTGHLPARRDPGGRYQLCPYPWSSLMISANGDVVACCRDLEHKSVMGNVFEQPLTEIWNGEPFQRLRSDLAAGRPEAQPACAGCDLPWDASKFSLRNQAHAVLHRLQMKM